jgi:hypothetical protein
MKICDSLNGVKLRNIGNGFFLNKHFAKEVVRASRRVVSRVFIRGTTWSSVFPFLSRSLYPQDRAPLLVGYQLGWLSITVDEADERKISSLPEIKPRFSSRPVRCVVSIVTATECIHTRLGVHSLPHRSK